MKSVCDLGCQLFLISLNQGVLEKASFQLELFKDLVMSAH